MWSWLAVALSCLLFIFAGEKGDKARMVVFSGLTHILLAVILIKTGMFEPYQMWILVGLALFTISDGVVQWRRFTKLSFFGYITAQLAYSWAMWGQVNSEFVLWLPALLFCIAIVTFLLLLPRLDSFLMPVALMGLSLVHLMCAAGEAWLITRSFEAMIGFAGAACLALSALLLALDKYHFQSKRASYAVSGSYYLAHSLIVASALSSSTQMI
ncbi:lysoplasmalogenase family protein [Vibrio maritimus]|uniref:lysoplasmalogenase family protein n=1 Tax=Vibrio maritimus TaxID=990268 RepID=UPI003736F10D